MAVDGAEVPAFESIDSHDELIDWSRAYAREARREWLLDVRLDLVEWTVSTRARRRAAAVKRPQLPDATVGEPINWDDVPDSDGRPLPCTVALTWDAFAEFSRSEWASTLRHELLHVEQFQRFGTTDHGAAFRRRAQEIETDMHCRSFATPEWLFRCGDCGRAVARRYRDCQFVAEYEQYRSECCWAPLTMSHPES
ncbi:SprT-like domain-containing protein [Halorhabdus sp. CUG00001]|uniref:SprT-like domain-containing protein n=1 Tax=Halorhabdus sp. CUG00001 TaxID=2600297 RepID=UPI00131EB32E|nr:SprT-like domain-containing protein [Halorhabdus sp. CUG00001]